MRPGKEGHWLSLVTSLFLLWFLDIRSWKTLTSALISAWRESALTSRSFLYAFVPAEEKLALYTWIWWWWWRHTIPVYTCVLVRTVSLLVVLCLANETPHCSITISTSRVTLPFLGLHLWSHTQSPKDAGALDRRAPAARCFEHLWLLCRVQPAHLNYGSYSSILHPGLPRTGSVNSGLLVGSSLGHCGFWNTAVHVCILLKVRKKTEPLVRLSRVQKPAFTVNDSTYMESL